MKNSLKAWLRAAGFEIRRVNRKARGTGNDIHFLHIGKNAGTQIGNVADQVNALSSGPRIIKHPHHVGLGRIPVADPYFFSIRHPVSRFKSGFYSRKRKGQPRIYSEWSAHDEIAFSEFEHANDLAESLFEPGERGRKAWAAMKSIRHTSQNQSDWFSCHGNFLRVRPPIWIVRQEHFDADLRDLVALIFADTDLPKIDLGDDDGSAHRNDYTSTPSLSETAKANLSTWYAQDIGFYDMCTAWLESGGKF